MRFHFAFQLGREVGGRWMRVWIPRTDRRQREGAELHVLLFKPCWRSGRGCDVHQRVTKRRSRMMSGTMSGPVKQSPAVSTQAGVVHVCTEHACPHIDSAPKGGEPVVE